VLLNDFKRRSDVGDLTRDTLSSLRWALENFDAVGEADLLGMADEDIRVCHSIDNYYDLL
jgi:hypothetical protein